jgi:rubredoxin
MKLVEIFVNEVVLVEDQKSSEGDSNSSTRRTAGSKECGQTVEMLKEGQECPFCGLAKMIREGSDIVCPMCGYGQKAYT